MKFSTPIVEVKLYLSALHGADLKCRLAVVAQKNLEMLVAALIWSNTTLEKKASTNAEDSGNARGRVLKSFDWLVMTDAA